MMANFQLVPGDKNEQYDPGVGRLLVPQGGTAKIQLWGGATRGQDSWPLTVDVNNRSVAIVRLVKTNLAAWTFDYDIEGVNVGNAMLEARDFGPMCPTESVQRTQWFAKPVSAFIQLTVYPGYLQGIGSWAKTTYRSTNPRWRDVKWTNMAQAGCGPTSLAVIMEYVTSWDNAFLRNEEKCYAPNVTPIETMNYTSQYGRAAGLDKTTNKVEPQGTDGQTMMDHLGTQWPGYASEKFGSGRAAVDRAEAYLKRGEILIFLCKDGDTYKYNSKSGIVTHHWPGHYMVLVGVDSVVSGAKQTFFIEDPSGARTKFISRAMLEKCGTIWRVYRQPTVLDLGSSAATVGGR